MPLSFPEDAGSVSPVARHQSTKLYGAACKKTAMLMCSERYQCF